MSDQELIKAAEEFLDAFEVVFGDDWSYTKEMLGIQEETEAQKKAALEMGLETIDIISENGNFIKPGIEDETEDWGARGILLSKYRALKELLGNNEENT